MRSLKVSRPLSLTVPAATVLALSACSNDAATPVQAVDWWNGPYAVPCSLSQQTQYVDGATVETDANAIPTELSSVGFAELNGSPGDEAVLQHSCGEVGRLSVWTSTEGGVQRLGEVEPPADVTDVRTWDAENGVLCVAFNVGDTPDTLAFSRPVWFSPDGLVVRDADCAVAGVPFANEDDVPDP